MTLRIHNTLTSALEPFSPLEPGHVRMYVCGMTVYDLCHLGHARSMVAFDVVQRWLKASGLRVTYVRNVTDIEDKIIKRALENGETIRVLTDRMVEALHQDADALGKKGSQGLSSALYTQGIVKQGLCVTPSSFFICSR